MPETCALVKFLSMFSSYSQNVHIFDIKNKTTIHYGKIRDLDSNGKINEIKSDKFVMKEFDVVHDWFIIRGCYEEENNGD